MLALLTKMAAYDQRTIGKADVAAWHEVLPDEVGLNDALSLVPKHYAVSRARMMPADVIEAVSAIRRERLARAGTSPIPGDLTWKQEKTWRQLWCEAVKGGLSADDAAASVSDQMDLPRELPPGTSDAVAAERKFLVQRLAESKAAPRPEPENRKPKKPRDRWGCWFRGSWEPGPNGDDVIVFGVTGDSLFMGNGPWYVPIAKLRDDLEIWLHRASERGFGTSDVLSALARAWCDLTGADDDKRAWAIAKVAEAIDPDAEDATLNRAHPTGGGV